MQKLVKLVRGDSGYGSRLVDQLFVQHVHRHIERSGSGSLADAALEHVKHALLNREFDIQHVFVMLFEFRADSGKFPVSFRKEFLHGFELLVLLVPGVVVQRIWCTGSGNDVFSLRIHKPFAVKLVVSGGGIAGECNACRRIVAHVSEHHALHIDGGSPLVRNALDAAVGNGFLSVPALEHGADSAPELFLRVIRELRLEHFPDRLLEIFAKLLEIGDGQIRIGSVFLRLLKFFELIVKLFADSLAFGWFNAFGFLHHDIGIHHDQTAVSVIDETLVLRLFDQSRNRFGGEPDVENGLHHSRHGAACAGTAGNQKRIRGIAELHPHGFLHFRESLFHLFLQAGRILHTGFEKVNTALRRNREPCGNREIQFCHFRKIRTFASEKFLHGRIAVRHSLAEEIHILFYCRGC